MSLWTSLDVLAAASSLMVAVFALSRGPSHPLRLPLALLAIDQFAWNVSSVSLALSGDIRYRWISTIASPLFVPLGLHFVLLFVGRARRLRLLVWLVYAVFCAKALYGFADFLKAHVDLAADLNAHRRLMLWLGPPFGLLAIALAAWHHRSATTEAERWRAKLLVVALVTVTVLLPTSWISGLGGPLPPLSAIGSLVFNFILAHLVLGVGIVEGNRRITLGLAMLASLAVVGLYVGLFLGFREHHSLLLITMTALTLGFAAVGRLVVSAVLRARNTLVHQATAGHFSTQMAHDLKNPLSAAIGAAEVLAEELRRKGLSGDQELAGKVVAQLGRIEETLERYRRMTRVEPLLVEVDVNALVRQVLSLKDFNAPAHVSVREELSPHCPFIRADPQLLASALENLVKNAFEAIITGGGVVTVSTRVEAQRLELAVRDTGAGMDPRVREQVFTPWFTTKAQGSGMGLAFVQQVARAHGGEARIDSTEGAGTRVELLLPLKLEATHA